MQYDDVYRVITEVNAYCFISFIPLCHDQTLDSDFFLSFGWHFAFIHVACRHNKQAQNFTVHYKQEIVWV